MEPDARANGLYWGSSKSVNQIADEMELSKGMLYGMIRPLPAELPCPRCATGMEYPNRTARERGLITCPSCGLEMDEPAARALRQAAAAATPIRDGGPPPWPRPAPERRAGVPPTRTRDPMMVGAGLLLIAAGLWLFRGLARR